jgi:hypothetical protein
MTLEDAKRWEKLERRARERGWTIGSLGWAQIDREPPANGKLVFPLMELGGDERTLATGDLDTIAGLLKSNNSKDVMPPEASGLIGRLAGRSQVKSAGDVSSDFGQGCSQSGS